MDKNWDDLSDLWRESVSPGVEAEVHALSGKVLRRARWVERVELLVCACLTVFIIFGVWRASTFASLSVGGTILGLLLWSAYTRYRLRREEWGAEERDRSNFVEGQIRRYRARVRRAWIDLALFAPATILGILYAALIQGDLPAVIAYLFSWFSLIKLMLVGGAIAFLVRRLMRHRAAVRGFTSILAEYQHEAAMDRAALERV